MNEIGAIPVKVSVKTRAIVTAGFAKEVDDVNQYPAVINKATPTATEFLSFFRSVGKSLDAIIDRIIIQYSSNSTSVN